MPASCEALLGAPTPKLTWVGTATAANWMPPWASLSPLRAITDFWGGLLTWVILSLGAMDGAFPPVAHFDIAAKAAATTWPAGVRVPIWGLAHNGGILASSDKPLSRSSTSSRLSRTCWLIWEVPAISHWRNLSVSG